MSDLLLIIEDDTGLQKQLKWSLSQYEIIIAANRSEAIAAIRRFSPAVATLDLGLPPDPSNASEGLATLKEILALAPATKIIVVTGNDDRDNAVQCIAMGAYDFYNKPLDPEVLALMLERAFKLSRLEQDHHQLQQQHSVQHGIIGTSPQMQAVIAITKKIAPTQATILITGESGTGKELLARAIHNLSARSQQPFIAVNCAAIPENLLESELFGYEKGAFTGAVAQTRGKIEYANGGTFFLDEIGDLPFGLQAKLLRFIQERIIERLGGRKEIPVDVRIICATHKNLLTLIEQGDFRGDLYYRLSEIAVNIPPLREREGDIMTIANTLLLRYCQENNLKEKHFSREASLALENHDWPGNIREMENRIKRAVILSTNNAITAKELELESVEENPMPFNLKEVREAAETAAIKRALNYTDYNISETAKLLGISRPTLYGLFEKYAIPTLLRNQSDE
jgi:two-component system NtrC family response regulator